MPNRRSAAKLPLLRIILLLLLCAAVPFPARAQTPAAATASKPLGILSKDEAGSLMPPSVFFRGLSAPIQARNAAGIRVSPDKLVLTAMVDTSGYSTSVKQRYQAYLLTELPLTIDGHALPPGAYGIGFIADDTFVVMDIGNHELLTAHSANDTALRRPTPLQILPDAAAPGSFRLYSGRAYVRLSIQPETGTQR